MNADTAGTGLALLAMLGAGYTHTEGKHQAIVQRGIGWLLGEQLLELGGQPAQEIPLLGAQAHDEVASVGPLDRCGRLPQSWRRVAQSPCACSRATSCSAFSRVPDETTALPSWWTCSMSSVAFARL